MKYEYNICTQADEEIFDKQCSALEKHLPGLIKKELIVDVDCSKIQYYDLSGMKIVVHNDHYVDAVYIESDIQLEQYFS